MNSNTASRAAVRVGQRSLMERWEGVEESVFRESVRDFEDTIMRSGVVEAPAVVTLDEWQALPPDRRPACSDEERLRQHLCTGAKCAVIRPLRET